MPRRLDIAVGKSNYSRVSCREYDSDRVETPELGTGHDLLIYGECRLRRLEVCVVL